MARSRTGLGEASASPFGRAVRWATGPAPELGDAERAARYGRVLAGLLSSEQRSRYAETTDRAAAAAFLTRERAAVLASRESLEPTGEESEALTVPWEPPGRPVAGSRSCWRCWRPSRSASCSASGG